MLTIAKREAYLGRRVLLAFRTTHFDKAGETSSVRVVTTELVEIDATGGAILVTKNGLHFRFPLAWLHQGPKPDEYIAGQELIRDFHNAVEPVTLRWLDRAAVQAAIAEGKKG